MQKKKIISTYLSLANYVADKIAIEIRKNYKNLNIQSYIKNSSYQIVTNLDLKIEKIVTRETLPSLPSLIIFIKHFLPRSVNKPGHIAPIPKIKPIVRNKKY